MNEENNKQTIINKVFWLILVATVLGIVDAAYLTYKHYSPTPLICSLQRGCETVTNSPYSTFGGIPVALLGVAYYLLMAVFLWRFRVNFHQYVRYAALIVAGTALLFSLRFVYLQTFILRAYCYYCMFSALLSLINFCGWVYLHRETKKVDV